MAKALRLEHLDFLTDALRKERSVYAPLPKDGEYTFLPLGEERPELGCAVTIMPPKRVLQPEIQTLFNYRADGRYEIEAPPLDEKRAILGVRPCDVHAMLACDQVFTGSFRDAYWWERRKNTLIVAANCVEPAEECFCSSWGTGPGLGSHYDLLLTDLENGWLLEVGSDEGERVANTLGLPPADQADLDLKHQRLVRATAAIKKVLSVKPSELPGFLEERFDHPSWRPQADVCFSCGNCTLVCPTCYCFNVFEDYSPALHSGEREAEWDSCQLLGFSEITHGFNFRRTRLDRFKHRAVHKLSWMMKQYGRTGCVGCGRCVRWCPSWPVRRGRATSLADPVEIVGDLMEAA